MQVTRIVCLLYLVMLPCSTRRPLPEIPRPSKQIQIQSFPGC
jgi:hypothetical protein